MTSLPRCLVIDDDSIVIEYFIHLLNGHASVTGVQNTSDVERIIKSQSFDLVFLDVNLGHVSGLEILSNIRSYLPDLPVVLVSNSTEINDAIRGFRMGAIDFLTKPFDDSLVKSVLKRAVRQSQLLQSEKVLLNDKDSNSRKKLIGESKLMRELQSSVSRLKDSEIDTLIVAESGCGKELIARALNEQENDPRRPFITLNCAALPKELLESILFGHEKGSFTGAHQKQIGKFELAHNGDIFLDEIGTLSPDLQAKLLRVLQEREIEPIGSGLTKKINFRVIAATNEDLEAMVKSGTFRKDLYYRLNKVTLRIPPLRERKSDIPLLIQHFLRGQRKPSFQKTMSVEAINLLSSYSWPGNVRELENVIENLSFTVFGSEITLSDIEALNLRDDYFYETEEDKEPEEKISKMTGFDLSVPLDQQMMKYEKEIIAAALERYPKKLDVARHLGIDRKTLFRKIKAHGIEMA